MPWLMPTTMGFRHRMRVGHLATCSIRLQRGFRDQCEKLSRGRWSKMDTIIQSESRNQFRWNADENLMWSNGEEWLHAVFPLSTANTSRTRCERKQTSGKSRKPHSRRRRKQRSGLDFQVRRYWSIIYSRSKTALRCSLPRTARYIQKIRCAMLSD